MERDAVHQVRIERGEQCLRRISGCSREVDTKHTRHATQRVAASPAVKLRAQLHRHLIIIRQAQGVDDSHHRSYTQHLEVQFLIL